MFSTKKYLIIYKESNAVDFREVMLLDAFSFIQMYSAF